LEQGAVKAQIRACGVGGFLGKTGDKFAFEAPSRQVLPVRGSKYRAKTKPGLLKTYLKSVDAFQRGSFIRPKTPS
jgi:hypothetical protein